jgi:hypothetical protein
MSEGRGEQGAREKKTRKRTWRRGTQDQTLQSKGWTLKALGGKTIWDWLQLLIVPFALTVIGFLFTMQQDIRQQKIEDQRAESERQLGEQRAQDAALQAYLDQMSTLLLADEGLRESKEGSEVRTLARARTLTVLGRLDGDRKWSVIQFLYESGLISKDAVTVDLEGTDLSKSNLSGANLSDAGLGGAGLFGAEGVTKEMLEQQAKSICGATMPDGTIYPGRYASKEFYPAVSFEVGEGWYLPEAEAANHISVVTGPKGGQLSFTNASYVFDPSNPSEAKAVPAPKNAKEWVSWFQRHPNLDTSKPLPVSVGGVSGKRIDVTASSMPENYPRKVCGDEPCVPLYPMRDESGISSYEGWKERFGIVDVEGEDYLPPFLSGRVLIDVAAPTDKFDAFLPKAQKVLDSVEWKGG